MKNSDRNNHSGSVNEFVLLGFPGSWEIQIFLFSLFSVTYILTLIGNMSIICAVSLDQRLHTPMYILLANFSFLEIWYVTSTVPNMLANFLSDNKIISFTGCFLQFYFFFSMGTTETFFLSAMAYDRYLAICRPLHYPTIMTTHLCTGLVIFGWSCGFVLFLIPVVLISQLSYCGPNIIDHFVCDPVPLMALSCSKAHTTKLIYSTFNTIFMIGTFIFILISYALVIISVLRIPSAAGKHKIFSTCASHLAVVILFFGSVMMMYVRSGSEQPVGFQKVVTLFYSVVTPLINPLIYSLRNKDMKAALRKILVTKRTSHKT
ncbi:olfactory receptor 11G2-like [Sarcophilus harrisii]